MRRGRSRSPFPGRTAGQEYVYHGRELECIPEELCDEVPFEVLEEVGSLSSKQSPRSTGKMPCVSVGCFAWQDSMPAGTWESIGKTEDKSPKMVSNRSSPETTEQGLHTSQVACESNYFSMAMEQQCEVFDCLKLPLTFRPETFIR